MNDAREIVAAVLGVNPEALQAASGPRDFPQWDSAAHIDIVLSLEAEYGLTFSPEEMLELLSVGAIEEALERKARAR